MRSLKYIGLSLVVSLTLGFSGCGSATGPKFTNFEKPKKGQGLLYVYRPSAMPAMLRDMSIVNVTDEKLIGILENASYLVSELEPGEYNIVTDTTNNWINPLVSPISLFFDTGNKHHVIIKENQVSCISVYGDEDEQVDESICESKIINLHTTLK